MQRVNRERNIFLDSEQSHTAGDLVKIYLPNDAFSTRHNETMKISLSTFEMQKKFYNINSYNNTFYALAGATYTEIKIAEGDYFQFGDTHSVAGSLCEAIYNAISTAIAAPQSVSYNINTRKLSIDMSGVSQAGKWDATAYFVSFQIPPSRQGTLPTNVTANGYFNDSYEILGAKPTKYNSPIVEAFSENSRTFTSFYPASLYTIESIHLTTSLQTNNYQSPSLDADSKATRLIPTQVLARIPIDMGKMFEGNKQDVPSIIKFEDTGATLYSMTLQQNEIDVLNFRLVDAKGREIDQVSNNQYANGALSYKLVLKWEAIDAGEVGQPSGFLSNSHQLQPRQENRYISRAF